MLSRSFRSTSLATIGLLVLVATASGCVRLSHQSVSRLWDRVRWTAQEEAAEANDSPTVSANVAQTVPQTDKRDRSTPEERPATVAANAAVAPPMRNISDSDGTTPDPVAEALSVSPSRRVRELKEALSADADQETAQSPGLSGSQSLRLRVDGLLRRANELLRVGQLRDARRTAQLAAELSDSAVLEFLPTEDRPYDVLREIEDRLQAERSSQPRSYADPASEPASSANRPRTAADVADSDRYGYGTVLANGPYALEDRSDAHRPPEPSDDDVLTLPGLLLRHEDAEHRTAGERALLANLPWKDPGVDAGTAAAAWADPLPPKIDAIAPLTTFRSREAAAPSAAAARPELPSGPWFSWSDGLALFLMAALLVSVGLALQIRRWRFG